MTRTFAPLLGLAALAASLFSPAPTSAQDYAVTVTDLTPASGFRTANGSGIYRAAQVGSGTTTTNNNAHALLWTGSAASAVDLNVSGPAPIPGNFQFFSTSATGVFGDTQVGYGYAAEFDATASIALLWHGTADSVVYLNPPDSGNAQAFAVSGDTQVGQSDFHAVLWHGTADSMVNLNPSGFPNSEAKGVSGNTQVGDASRYQGSNYVYHAFLWHGTAESAVDLNPANFMRSYAYAASGNAQGGFGALTTNNNALHALLWHGTANSAVDLNPIGFYSSRISAVSGETQVGYGQKTSGDFDPSTALLWRSTAKSALDLSQFLPAAFQQSSQAYGVDDHNGVVKVVGYGSGHAFLWRVVFAPTLTGISPTTRTAGTGKFTLTVTGTRFTHQSFIRCTQRRLPTTFVNSEHLQAVIPASFITQHGTTYYIQVSTPGVDTAGVQVLTIR